MLDGVNFLEQIVLQDFFVGNFLICPKAIKLAFFAAEISREVVVALQIAEFGVANDEGVIFCRRFFAQVFSPKAGFVAHIQNSQNRWCDVHLVA